MTTIREWGAPAVEAGAPCSRRPGDGRAAGVSELADLSVRRVSVGSGLARAAWTGFMRAAKLLAQAGSVSGFDGSVSFAELDGLFREDRAPDGVG